MKFTQEAVIDAPVSEIDLEGWLFTLSDSDYQAAAKGHLGSGTFEAEGVRGVVNIESMGGALIIQHFREVHAKPGGVEMISARSRAYVFHVVPVPVWVRWTMSASTRTADTTTFQCHVEIELPTAVKYFTPLIGLSYFIRKHIDEETAGFAADITRKLPAHQSR